MKFSILAPLCLILLAAIPAGAIGADGYMLNNRSEFQRESVDRNPFWPIGHVHQPDAPAVRKTVKPAEVKLSADAFVVSSILIGGEISLAVINGKDVAEGDTIEAGGIKVRIAEIRDGKVLLRHQDQEVAAPLRLR